MTSAAPPDVTLHGTAPVAADGADDAPLLRALRPLLATGLGLALEDRLALVLAAARGAPTPSRRVHLRVLQFLRDTSRAAEPDPAVMRILVGADVVQHLVAALATHAHDPRVCAVAAAALGNVAAGSFAAAKSVVVQSGGVAAVLALLHRHGGDDTEVAVQGLRCLGNATFGMDNAGASACKAAIVHGGGLGVILATMTARAADASVARWACHALANVAYGRAPNAQQVGHRCTAGVWHGASATPHPRRQRRWRWR